MGSLEPSVLAAFFCSVAAEIFITNESIMNLCVPPGAALLPSPS